MAALRMSLIAFDPSGLESVCVSDTSTDCFGEYLFLQLKQPRRDLVCPFLGIGLRGNSGTLRFPLSDNVGESLEELSTTLPRSCGDDIDRKGIRGTRRIQHVQFAGTVPLWRYIFCRTWYMARRGGPRDLGA
jgi:hypothetical protein